MNEIDISKLVDSVLQSMSQSASKGSSLGNASGGSSGQRLSAKDYPIQEKRPELIKTATGRPLSEITFQNFLKGNISAKDMRVAPETLEYHAQIAESTGRTALARNMRRAAEMIPVPDERVLEIYNALRPNRSSKAELLAIADELDSKYSAKALAAHVREAAEVYEQRDVLRRD